MSVSTPPAHSLGTIGFIEAMVLGIWMIDGWEVTASTSEETRAAARVAGIGGIVGLLVTAVFLIVCTLAYMHAGGVQGLAANQTDVLAFVGERLGGMWRTLLVITVLVSLAATLETTLLYLVRSVYAMGRDGVLPGALGALGARTRDPDIALIVVTIASLVAMAIVGLVPSANDRLALVLNGSAVFLGVLFLISCLAALRLRREETPLFAAMAALALVVILTVAIVQAAPATRLCILVAICLGMPLALGFAMRERMRKGQSPAAGNIGG
jgi:amino acid transporter